MYNLSTNDTNDTNDNIEYNNINIQKFNQKFDEKIKTNNIMDRNEIKENRNEIKEQETKYSVKKISKKNNNKRSYKKHIISINENNDELDEPCFSLIDDIRIYDGTTLRIRKEYNNKNLYLKSLLNINLLNEKLILSKLKTSTLTVKAKMTNISFDEKVLIHQLSIPTGYINKIKSKYGVLVNPEYKEKEIVKPSNRGRKPDKKKEKKFFNTQITFYISKDPNNMYIIKLFRNGVFQVSGIKFKSMTDLIPIANILKDYLIFNLKKDITIVEFKAVMRNYKCCVIDNKLLISLKKLENILKQEKENERYNNIIDTLTKDNLSSNIFNSFKDYISNSNLMNIAEITYISGKSLNVKLYRPKPEHLEKKITIKIYIKGKINFDGFNSQIEVDEAYYWLNHIFKKYQNKILIDKHSIKNEVDEDTDKESIYDDNIFIDEINDDEFKVIPKIPINRKKLLMNELNNKADDIFNYFR